MLTGKGVVLSELLNDRMGGTRGSAAGFGTQRRIEPLDPHPTLGTPRSVGSTKLSIQVRAVGARDEVRNANGCEDRWRRARRRLTKLGSERRLNLGHTLSTGPRSRALPALRITCTLRLKRGRDRGTRGMCIAQETVQTAAMALCKRRVNTKLKEHRTRRTRRRIGKLDAKRSGNLIDAVAASTLVGSAAGLLALGLAGSGGGETPTLLDVAQVGRPRALQIGEGRAERASKGNRATRGGSSDLGLKPGTNRRAQRPALLTTQIDEPPVKLATSTFQNRRGRANGAGNLSCSQPARGSEGGLKNRLRASHELRVPGRDARINERT